MALVGELIRNALTNFDMGRVFQLTESATKTGEIIYEIVDCSPPAHCQFCRLSQLWTGNSLCRVFEFGKKEDWPTLDSYSGQKFYPTND